MNPSNALLLVAPLDFLFDQYLISFNENGRVRIAPTLEEDKQAMDLFGVSKGMKIRKVLPGMEKFLKKHRQRFCRLHGS
ncbi:MAG: putative restriction endonuclease [Candidatus Sumerlaeota bacterium]|nr:putative restriction endonuclease [Candidatus Sumerlaeota bacterium]